jgi:hypothetical protein
VPTKELDKMAKHFSKTGHAWFIKNHMIKNGYKIPSDCEALLGNSSGPYQGVRKIIHRPQAILLEKLLFHITCLLSYATSNICSGLILSRPAL